MTTTSLIILSTILFCSTHSSPLDSPHGHFDARTTNSYCRQCILSNMILANLYRMVHLPYENFIRDARRTLIKTELECQTQSHRLDGFVKAEMTRQWFHADLVHECPLQTIPYNLFLCRMEWDDGVGEIPDCRSSCGGEIERWTRWHRSRGVEEFPPGWFGQLNNKESFEVRRDLTPTPRKYSDIDHLRQFGEGLDEISGYVRRKRQHGVPPRRVPRRFVKEFFHTNEVSNGNWTQQARCRDDEWPYAIEDGLPFGITIHCWGPRGFAGTHTLGVIMQPHLIDCNKTAQYFPPNGTLLIGMSNRIVYSNLEFLVAGVFLCSGDERWSAVKPKGEYNTVNGTGEIVRCRPGTIICTFELKMARFENKFFTTDVRVGCCEAPERLLYSSFTLVPRRLTRFSKYQNITLWTDIELSKVVYDRDIKNVKLIKSNLFIKTLFVDPYGGYLNSARLSGLNITQYLLFFGYSRFDDITEREWADQNPLLTGDSTDTGKLQTCVRGFFKGMVMRDCPRQKFSISITCTDGTSVPVTTRKCPEVPPYSFECPAKHLVCGLWKVAYERGELPYYVAAWAGYQYTFICCPVIHTAEHICGPSGAVLSIEDAKVDCIAVSGTDTTCTTTQSFGYTMGSNVVSGTTTSKATDNSYGYSTTDRLSAVASASTTISASTKVSGGVPGLANGEVEMSVSGTFGVMISTGRETTDSKSTTDKTAEGFSFAKAAAQAESSSKETKTQYTILDGQRTLFYDVVRTCGATKMKSEDFIRILTPSVKCDANITFEYATGWRTLSHGSGKRTLTFSGFGLEIEADTFINPLERGVNWELISLGVKEKFTESIALSDENGRPFGGYDFQRSSPALWERATNTIQFNFTVDLKNPMTYRFYRLVGRCGRWRAITNSIWYQRDLDNLFGHTKQPPSPKHDLFTGPSVWIADT